MLSVSRTKQQQQQQEHQQFKFGPRIFVVLSTDCISFSRNPISKIEYIYEEEKKKSNEAKYENERRMFFCVHLVWFDSI